MLVLGIHRGEPEPYEDIHHGTLERPGEFMHAVGRLVLHAHGHDEIAGDLVAYVDTARRYLYVTEGVCELLGYSCDEIIGRCIEDVTMPMTADTKRLFDLYLQERGQQGTYILRHKNGHPVPIRYRAHVLQDGCLAAEWEPLPTEGLPSVVP